MVIEGVTELEPISDNVGVIVPGLVEEIWDITEDFLIVVVTICEVVLDTNGEVLTETITDLVVNLFEELLKIFSVVSDSSSDAGGSSMLLSN